MLTPIEICIKSREMLLRTAVEYCTNFKPQIKGRFHIHSHGEGPFVKLKFEQLKYFSDATLRNMYIF